MPKKPLIAIDIDGTLLSPSYELLPFSKAYLTNLSKQGFCIVLSSGRPYRAMKHIYDELKCFGPIICYNGAHVFSPSSSFVEKKSAFPKDVLKKILEELSPHLEGWQIEDETNMYRHGIGDDLEDFFPAEGMNINVVSSVSLPINPYSVVFKEKERDDALFQSIVEKYPGIQWRHWTGSPYSELHLEGISKGKALAFAMLELGYAKENAYAFGDSDNDFEMLLEVAHPFAMANSKSKTLLERFPKTEKGNSEDGVAYELGKYF